MNKAEFHLDDGVVAEFYVLEQTRLSGDNYILVTDTEEGDGEALILKETGTDDKKELTYEVVSDDDLLSALAPLFENLLGDVEIISEES